MHSTFRLFLLLALLVAGLGFTPGAAAQAPGPLSAPDPDGVCPIGTTWIGGTSNGGARWIICLPPITPLNGLVIYAHGYESPIDPADPKRMPAPTFANLTIPGSVSSVPELVLSRGFAFGATTYRRTGLVAADGIEDVAAVALAAQAAMAGGPPFPIYVVGVSEGGLVTTLAVEKYPTLFAGGLAACGPIGSFREQINYFGDFRVLYDYYFPDVLPGNATNIPTAAITQWPKFLGMALNAEAQNPGNAGQLMSTSHAAFVGSDPTTVGQTTAEVLWYNIFATMNAKDVLGGNPFDNKTRVYSGSLNDTALNLGVKRYAASPTALANLQAYETTGNLSNLAGRLVILHNTLDPVIPYQHQVMYMDKTVAAGASSKLISIAVNRYGHCNFTEQEVVAAFTALVAPVATVP